MEQLFDAAPVLDGLAQGRNQGLGHIHGCAASLGTEGKQPGRMLIAPLASRAVFADAGFIDLSQGAFDDRPEGGDLI